MHEREQLLQLTMAWTTEKSPHSNLEFIKVTEKLLSSQNIVLYCYRGEETLIEYEKWDKKESLCDQRERHKK